MITETLFIGAGNMGGAILRSLLTNDSLPSGRITLVDTNHAVLSEFRSNSRIDTVTSLDQLESSYRAQAIVLAIKPQYASDVITAARAFMDSRCCVVSIMAGRAISTLEEDFQVPAPIIRCMPNLPIMISDGVTLICPNVHCTIEEIDFAKQLFSSASQVFEVHNEDFINAGTAISG
ncbi:MAG: NAD(P)-binding domain-containing protein, partial [Bdellovibrionales bacterium]|nr:NAD(P)-binding domain-containing protein [Bdellovibrionales bacterium]